MALFTDGAISGIEDLTAQDSQLLNVASTEGIDVTQKLAAAQEEIGLEMHTLLTRLSGMDQQFWLAAQPDLESVVVTPALRLWHTFRALELVYSDAYNSQLNDRYAGKRDQFHKMAKWAYEKLVETGIGLAWLPVARAATPVVAAAPGSVPDGTYYVSMTWTNRNGEEGAAAIPAAITVAGSTFLVQPGEAPRNATGWNVYVGEDPGAMSLKSEAPMAPEESWQAGEWKTGGRAPGCGQSPSYMKPVPRVIQRG
ncbi:MAG: hypothetical protein LAP87_07725 [Acidobacteriia bacterium]|nr:hypothetical protein [Terriglobia bacterium]